MTQDERDLLVWVARKIAGLQCTDQRHEAPYVDAMIRKIREAERLQQEQWNALARGSWQQAAVAGLDENAMPKRE